MINKNNEKYAKIISTFGEGLFEKCYGEICEKLIRKGFYKVFLRFILIFESIFHVTFRISFSDALLTTYFISIYLMYF